MCKKEELIVHLADNVGYMYSCFLSGNETDVNVLDAIHKLTDVLRLCGSQYSMHVDFLLMQGFMVDMKNSSVGVESESYVYALYSQSTGLTKIGYSSRFDQRMREITHMNGGDLDLVLKTPGGSDLESALHKKFKAKRKHGEWFSLSKSEISRLPSISSKL